MLVFARRRSAAALEALLFGVILSVLAGLTGLTALPGVDPTDRSIAQARAGGEVLEGVLTIEATTEQPDGTHWTATLMSGGRSIPVKISHDDSHRTELMGATVDIQGTWTADGTFVADAIEPVDAHVASIDDEGNAPAAASPAPRGKQKTIEGILTLRHGDDFARGRSTTTRYVLATSKGDVKLTFSRPPSTKLAGARIRVTGTTDQGRFNVADGGTTVVGPSSATGSIGAKHVAVILFNFANDTSQPYTTAFARGVAFDNGDSVAAYYNESSWGQTTLDGDVFGWYTIPSTNSSCAYSTWSTAASAVVAAAGIDLSTYINVVYAFPETTCGWSGLANMPGRTVWLNGPMAMTLRVMAHELGHNFGTHHANKLDCTMGGVRVPLSATASDCTSSEYGDPFSVMGMAIRYQHTNFAKGNLGWLSTANTQTVTESGDYLLAPVEVESSTAVSSLRIQRTSGTWFNLEYRQHYGSYFETFASTAPVVNGVTIRITSAYSILSQ